MKKNLLYICLFLSLISSTSAQQLPIFTQYQGMTGLINPAAVNSDYLIYKNNLNFGITARSQWIKSNAAPQTQVAYGNFLWENNGGMSWLSQGYLIHDKTGRIQQTGIYGSTAGIISNGDVQEFGLAFGVGAGVVNYAIDLSNVTVRQADDLIATSDQSIWHPDFSLGFNFYKGIDRARNYDYFYVGASSPQVFGLKPKYKEGNLIYSFNRTPHIYSNVGYIFALENDSYCEVFSWLKYIPNAIFHSDINVRGNYRGLCYAGFGVGTSGFFHIEGGVRLGENQGLSTPIKIGYSYDNSLFTKYNTQSLGSSHELNISIYFTR